MQQIAHICTYIFKKILRGRPPSRASSVLIFQSLSYTAAGTRPFTVNATSFCESWSILPRCPSSFLARSKELRCRVAPRKYVEKWHCERPAWKIPDGCECHGWPGYHGLFCHCLNTPTVCSESPSLGKKWMAMTTTSLSTVRTYDNRLTKQHVLSDEACSSSIKRAMPQ